MIQPETQSTPFFYRGSLTGPSGSVGVNYLVDYTLQRKSTSGVKNPTWRTKIRNGSSASTTYSATYVDVTPATFVAQLPFGTSKYDVSGAFSENTALGAAASVLTEVDNRANTNVRRQIQQQEATFQALIPLAEVGELRGLVSKMASFSESFVREWHSLRHLKHKRRLSSLDKKKLSDTWLTYSFGISPLKGDAQGIASALAAAAGSPMPFSVNGSAKLTTSNTSLSNARSWNLPGSAQIRATARIETSVLYKGVAVGKWYSSNSYRDLNRRLGLSLDNFVPLIWEVTPYSFIVDYFTNVGDVFEDTFVVPPVTFKYLQKNVKQDSYTTLYPIYQGQGTFTGTPGFIHQTAFSRSPLQSLPSRSLSVKSFDSIGRNSVNRLLNLIALLNK